MDDLEVGDLRIAFEMVGDGPPLVLLHGGLSDHRTWRPQLERLSDEFTVVAWDAPGCGGSSDPPPTFRLPEYADSVAGLIDGLGLTRPHVLGLSFGAGLALQFYERHPHLPASLVLAGAYAGWAGSLPADEVDRRLSQALRDAERPASDWVDDYLPTFFASEVPAEARQRLTAMLLDSRPAGMVPMLRGFAEADLRHVLGTIAVPTLLLYGERDARSPLDVARELHEAIPGSRLEVLPGVGHVCNIEAPAAFDATVRDFLRGVGPSAI
jgi:pimeloyl-ACP methyl ester carboxylesterase